MESDRIRISDREKAERAAELCPWLELTTGDDGDGPYFELSMPDGLYVLADKSMRNRKSPLIAIVEVRDGKHFLRLAHVIPDEQQDIT